MKAFDIIIATYNRKESLNRLVKEILECNTLPKKLIIVDSSEKAEKKYDKESRIKYIHCPYKNQPLQRYIGFCNSISDFLFFFDDDMRIVDKKCFEYLIKNYNKKNIVGIQPNFDYKNKFFDNKIPHSPLRSLARKYKLIGFLRFLGGNPEIANGKFWFNGLRSEINSDTKNIEWLCGPVFSVRRSNLYKNFNFQLFKLYEKNLGKGEDAILGYTLAQQGEIFFHHKKYFYHDDQENSQYTKDIFSYAQRVMYSRLYMSIEFSRLNKSSLLKALFLFLNYGLSRVLILIFNQLIDYQKDRNSMINGYFTGIIRACIDIKKLAKFAPYWEQ